MNVVIDGVYETKKMKVEIGECVVSKTFKESSTDSTRYRREKIALQRLSRHDSFPQLMSFDDKEKILKLSRLPGSQPRYLSSTQVNLLRKMVANMHQEGVARHAMPIRDLIASHDQELGMVDFERVTLRQFSLSPIWLIAKAVSKYHLCRLIQEQQPHLLSESERTFLKTASDIRAILQKLKPLKRKIKSVFH